MGLHVRWCGRRIVDCLSRSTRTKSSDINWRSIPSLYHSNNFVITFSFIAPSFQFYLIVSLGNSSIMGRKLFFAQQDNIAKEKRRRRLEKSECLFGAHADEDAIRDKDKRLPKTKRVYLQHAELWKE